MISFLHSLLDPDLAFIFFWLGLALIVFELLAPGHIVSGTLGGLMFIAALVSFGVLPVRLIGILLLVLSVIFFLLELKVPGLGAWSIAGIVSLVLGGLTLFNGAGGVRVSPLVIAPVAGMVALFFGFVVAKMMTIRTMPPPQGLERLIGREGEVIGAGLSPDGIVRVAAEEWGATSTVGPLHPGTRVRVASVRGLRLTVEPVAQTEEASATTETSPSSSRGGSST